jgi:hypothetical protein
LRANPRRPSSTFPHPSPGATERTLLDKPFEVARRRDGHYQPAGHGTRVAEGVEGAFGQVNKRPGSQPERAFLDVELEFPCHDVEGFVLPKMPVRWRSFVSGLREVFEHRARRAGALPGDLEDDELAQQHERVALLWGDVRTTMSVFHASSFLPLSSWLSLARRHDAIRRSQAHLPKVIHRSAWKPNKAKFR